MSRVAWARVDELTGLATWRWTVRNTRGETAVRARVDALWRRAPGAQSPPPDEDDELEPAGAAGGGLVPPPI